MKKWLLLPILAGLAFAASWLAVSSSRSTGADRVSTTSPTGAIPIWTVPTPAQGVVHWASSAATIPELAAEADLIARVRVVQDPQPRRVTFQGSMLDANGTPIGVGSDTVHFSDTEMEVLEVYQGSAPQFIWVMQTGDRTVGVLDGHLYAVGEEAILFLVDISDDPIHAAGRALYRTVNPAGRYMIQGSRVLSQAEAASPATPPLTIDELVGQIKEAIKEQP